MSLYICIKNDGCFDVVNAINMLGASVKEKDDPIGVFGSGTKFALAQAAREGIKVTITSGMDIYSVVTEDVEFRNKGFKVVCLKTKTGKIIRTPLTTDFGKEDWNDTWFIFREFFSNAIDEGSRDISIVNGITSYEDCTCVYLPYYDFKHIYENLTDYFRTSDKKFVSGTGRVFKKGVFVGKLDECNIDLFDNDVKINECRTMDAYSAVQKFSYYFDQCLDLNTWINFFRSGKKFLSNIYVTISNEDVSYVANSALMEVFGDNYCICPEVFDIISDVTASGCFPVIFPNITFDNKIFKTYKSLNLSSNRELNSVEREFYTKCRKKISALFCENINPEIRIIKSNNDRVLGEADMCNNIISLSEKLFSDEKEMIATLIHELGHIVTGCGDYDRRFIDCFVNKLAELCM